jgi:hypothetical protein
MQKHYIETSQGQGSGAPRAMQLAIAQTPLGNKDGAWAVNIARLLVSTTPNDENFSSGLRVTNRRILGKDSREARSQVWYLNCDKAVLA